jgi:HSP20 family protein
MESFERVVALPVDVKLEGIKAEFKDGVLEIRLPKEKTSREVKIEIQ